MRVSSYQHIPENLNVAVRPAAPNVMMLAFQFTLEEYVREPDIACGPPINWAIWKASPTAGAPDGRGFVYPAPGVMVKVPLVSFPAHMTTNSEVPRVTTVLEMATAVSVLFG